MTRVTQQHALYASERRAPRGRQFDSQAEIQTWLNEEIVNSAWWQERYPKVKWVNCPTVKRSQRDGSVGTWYEDDWTGQIEMWEGHWNQLYLCHELAHVVGSSVGAHGHDPAFARVYLELVYLIMGSGPFLELRNYFVEDGICFSPECVFKPECECR